MPAKSKGPHHQGTYHVDSARVRAWANSHPEAKCWRCGKTLAEIRTTKPRAKWQAGHLVDGQTNGPLLPECSPCNAAGGARQTNQAKKRTPLTW